MRSCSSHISKLLTGSFIDSAAPYRLFSSTYMIERSLSVASWPFEFDAVTQWLLQKAMTPRIDRSNNRYISGVGHREIVLLTLFRAADIGSLLGNVCRPNHPRVWLSA